MVGGSGEGGLEEVVDTALLIVILSGRARKEVMVLIGVFRPREAGNWAAKALAKKRRLAISSIFDFLPSPLVITIELTFPRRPRAREALKGYRAHERVEAFPYHANIQNAERRDCGN